MKTKPAVTPKPKCKCFYTGAVQLCPLHASAPDLLKTLAKVLRWINVGMDGIGEIYNLKDDIEKIITKSGGLT